MTQRFVCVHGHFYQPPRENPWLEAIEPQDSAHPYHDWNEKINAECYAPNTASRILDDTERIVRIVNNYARISFNFGPTLLSWLEKDAPEVYRALLAADGESRKIFSGHGSAMAQAYNHMIMPLANRRDKITQAVWGIRDFEHRFGRKPEGMWLPETAVDLETLDILAEMGIRFTILSQRQAKRWRKIGSRSWEQAGGAIDPAIPYEMTLESGRKIALFFYDDAAARGVAFEGLLSSGEKFARRLLGIFSDARPWPQLAHIATDGESYGHHHRYGDMALAYALDYIESGGLARLANYGEFLEKYPPTHTVEILENTSWSCAHGIERWRGDCGCNSGGRADWRQAWRAPLREAFDWLRDSVNSLYVEHGGELFKDVWAAREAYISVILDRSADSVDLFLRNHGKSPLDGPGRVRALKLLELQRHLQLMYTSCGWFFDDLSGIETVQVIQYAARALQLAEDLFKLALKPEFLSRLARAKSNSPELGDGRAIYEKSVEPAVVDLRKVAAHYAITSLFGRYDEKRRIHCYHVEPQGHKLLSSAKARLALGKARITSEVTQESSEIVFVAVHSKDHHVQAAVRDFSDVRSYGDWASRLERNFSSAPTGEELNRLAGSMGKDVYSIRTLFHDGQRRIMNMILDETLSRAAELYRRLYNENAPMMRYLSELKIPLPQVFHSIAEFALNEELKGLLENPDPDPDAVGARLEDIQRAGVRLDSSVLTPSLQRLLERLLSALKASPEDKGILDKARSMVSLAKTGPLSVPLWRAQNAYYDLMKERLKTVSKRAEQGDMGAKGWLDSFLALGRSLSIKVE